MQFSIFSVLALAVASVSASPIAGTTTNSPGSITVEQAANQCQSGTTLQCCNQASASGDKGNPATGLLAGALGGDGLLGQGLLGQCSKIDVAAAIGANDLLNKQCQQTAACCQGNSPDQSGALVAVGCVPISGLI